jgi:hypothetical protein
MHNAHQVQICFYGFMWKNMHTYTNKTGVLYYSLLLLLSYQT